MTASKGKWVDEHPSWSPDGEYVVFASTRDDHHAEIYRMRRDGTAITRLTKSEGDDWLPRWIP